MSRPSLAYHWLDVFTEQALSGNPLAVVFGGEALESATMQAIAREFNLSETVFVLPPRKPEACARLRIFTPMQELPFAGHPTVGTACLLAELGRVPAGADTMIVLDEEVGPVPVRLRRERGRAVHAQLTAAMLPRIQPLSVDAAALARLFGLAADDIAADEAAGRLVAASCGVEFNLIPIGKVEALSRSVLHTEHWPALQAELPCASFYLYCRDTEPLQFRARMFSPELGVGEDPATGSAAAALFGHLAANAPQPQGTLAWTILQGVEMKRPSRLEIEADKCDGAITAVRVGGYAIRVASGQLTL